MTTTTIAGNGDYRLTMKFMSRFSKKSLLNITINEKHQVVANLDVFRAANGHYAAYDQVIKFEVEDQKIKWRDEESEIVGKTLKVQVTRTGEGYTTPSALVLACNLRFSTSDVMRSLQDVRKQLLDMSQALQDLQMIMNTTSGVKCQRNREIFNKNVL
jgi:Malectin domain